MLRKIRLRKIIIEGGRYPFFYGRAWDMWEDIAFDRPVRVVCYPVPLNLIFRVAVNCWWWMHRGWRKEFARERFERIIAEEMREKLCGDSDRFKEYRVIGKNDDYTIIRTK